MDEKHMNEQANLAIEFIDKLYFEISYMIKETEGLLKQEDEEFLIGRPRGYGITVGSSTGLDFPDWWWYKKFSVFFVPKNYVEKQSGRTKTIFKKDLKIIYLIVVISDKDISKPKVALGVLYNIENKTKQYFRKFEDATVHCLDSIWSLAKIYANYSEGNFEDKNIKFKGKFIIRDLFDINSTQDIQKKLLIPTLKQYRIK